MTIFRPFLHDRSVIDHALRLWREREMQFPPRVRRMMPDDLDIATGAWAACIEAALAASEQERA